jgi:hypothetical protein
MIGKILREIYGIKTDKENTEDDTSD